MARKPETMTTTGGNPIADNQNRERIPERTVHAKGTAAYGTLTITREIVQRPRSGAVKCKFLAARR